MWWTFDGQNTQAHDVADPVTGPQTSDASVHCVNARVLGTPAVVSGRYGTGLQFDGTDDEAHLPHRPGLALADGDFTISTWVKYSATAATADQVVFWGYGTGAAERSIWLRAQPGQDRFYGYVQALTDAELTANADLGPVTAVHLPFSNAS